MVSAPVAAVVLIAAVAFIGLGGLDRLKAFAEKTKQGSINIFADQTKIAGGTAEVTRQDTIDEELESAGVMSLRGKTQEASILDIEPKIDSPQITSTVKGTVFLDNVSQEVKKRLTGSGTAQFSTGEVAILTDAQRQSLALAEFSPQELADIQALDQRRAAAIERGIAPNIKRTGAELVLAKREQEEISKSFLTKQFGGQTFVAGKLFGNPDFFVKGIDF